MYSAAVTLQPASSTLLDAHGIAGLFTLATSDNAPWAFTLASSVFMGGLTANGR